MNPREKKEEKYRKERLMMKPEDGVTPNYCNFKYSFHSELKLITELLSARSRGKCVKIITLHDIC